MRIISAQHFIACLFVKSGCIVEKCLFVLKFSGVVYKITSLSWKSSTLTDFPRTLEGFRKRKLAKLKQSWSKKKLKHDVGLEWNGSLVLWLLCTAAAAAWKHVRWRSSRRLRCTQPLGFSRKFTHFTNSSSNVLCILFSLCSTSSGVFVHSVYNSLHLEMFQHGFWVGEFVSWCLIVNL